MRLVALLSVREPTREMSEAGLAATPIRFGSGSPLDYQARQAIALGAEELLVQADAPSPDLTRATERLARETGVPVVPVVGGPALARRVALDDTILVLAERMIVPRPAIEALLAQGASALLVVPTRAATAHFERVDGEQVWAGAALLPAPVVLGTLDMLGDWDLTLTLLRRAVQQAAHRVLLSPDLASAGRLALLRDQGEADRTLAALISGAADASASGLVAPLAPLARPLVAELLRLRVDPARLDLLAGICGLAALSMVSFGWAAVALLLALLAKAAFALGAACSEVLLRRRTPYMRIMVEGCGQAVLAIMGGRLAQGQPLALAGVGVPLALVALLTLAQEREPGRGLLTGWRRWGRLTTGATLVIGLIGAAVNRPVEALLVIGLAAVGEAAVRLLARGENRI